LKETSYNFAILFHTLRSYTMQKTLIILAHPNMAQSRLNKALIETVKDEPNVTVHDIYATYKNADAIDVAKEQALLLAHDRIIFQFPLYWYSTPSLLKEWQDKVLEYGFAFGSTGDKLKGKEFKVGVTIGAAEEAYQPSGMMQATINELLKPLQTMALMTQMVFTPIFTVYGALSITDTELAQKAKEYQSIITTAQWNHA